MIIELIQTDLPEPVAPATRRCGIAAKSAITVLPYTSLPKASGILFFALVNPSSCKSSLRGTATFSSFAISMPTVSFPGIGARILIASAFVARARSASNCVILETLSPRLG